jgi:SAM-dependent methyltransferase
VHAREGKGHNVSHHAADLSARHRAEAAFHDEKYSTRASFPRHYRINPTYRVFTRMLEISGDIAGKRVLEYGCGDGWITTELARRGAHVTAFDISAEAVAQTRRALAAANLQSRCRVEVMGGEALEFPDQSFDLAFGFAILHHLDLTLALRELHRVLVPGGKGVFGEPLAGNPVINLYRRLTPQYRTEDEAPIDLRTFGTLASEFGRWEHHEQLLFAAGASALCYIPGLTPLAAPVQRWLGKLDDAVLRKAPWVGRWAWYSVLVLHRGTD